MLRNDINRTLFDYLPYNIRFIVFPNPLYHSRAFGTLPRKVYRNKPHYLR